jgi:hypothetical protein
MVSMSLVSLRGTNVSNYLSCDNQSHLRRNCRPEEEQHSLDRDVVDIALWSTTDDVAIA